MKLLLPFLICIIAIITYHPHIKGSLSTFFNKYSNYAPTTSDVTPQQTQHQHQQQEQEQEHSTPIPSGIEITKMSTARTIRQIFLAIEQSEGAGARVRRSIGTPKLRNFSPFLMLDHFTIGKGAGFPAGGSCSASHITIFRSTAACTGSRVPWRTSSCLLETGPVVSL